MLLISSGQGILMITKAVNTQCRTVIDRWTDRHTFQIKYQIPQLRIALHR